MNPTKKKKVATPKKKVAKKKKDGNKLVIHLEATVMPSGDVSNGDFHINGTTLDLAALLSTAMGMSHEFKRIVVMAASTFKKDEDNSIESILEEITDPMNHVGHGCDFDPKKKAPKKKTTKKSK